MNKYQEALNYLDFYCSVRHTEQQDLLQELVDRETPRKPDEIEHQHFDCNKCKGSIFPLGESKSWHKIFSPYHSQCGQKLDWSDEE